MTSPEPHLAALAERVVDLPSGYSVSVSTGDERLTVRAPDGRVCVTIRLTAEGPAVEVEAASLSLASRGDLSLVAGGDLSLVAGGALVTRAHHQHIESTHGDIHLEANDDVRVDGERIRLNAPEPPARAGR